MQMIENVNEKQTNIVPRMSINLAQDATVFPQSPKHEAIGFPTNAHLASVSFVRGSLAPNFHFMGHHLTVTDLPSETEHP